MIEEKTKNQLYTYLSIDRLMNRLDPNEVAVNQANISERAHQSSKTVVDRRTIQIQLYCQTPSQSLHFQDQDALLLSLFELQFDEQAVCFVCLFVKIKIKNKPISV